MKKGINYLIAALLIWDFAVQNVRANLVTIGFTAEVTHIEDSDGLLESRFDIDIGDPIIGMYTYDTSTPDSNPWEVRGTYNYTTSPNGILLNIGGFIVGTNPHDVDVTITVNDDYAGLVGGKHDSFILHSYHNLSFSESDFLIWDLLLFLWDSSYQAFSSDALPTTAPILDDWDTQNIDFGGGYPKSGFHIYGRLTSAVLIPEPGTFVLLGIGSLAILKKRRINKSRCTHNRI